MKKAGILSKIWNSLMIVQLIKEIREAINPADTNNLRYAEKVGFMGLEIPPEHRSKVIDKKVTDRFLKGLEEYERERDEDCTP